MAKADIQLVSDNRAVCDAVTNDSDLMMRVTEFDGNFIGGYLTDPRQYMRFVVWIQRKVALMSNLRTVMFPLVSYDDLKLMLDSLPLLTDLLHVSVTDNRMLGLLIEAKQTFTGLSLTIVEFKKRASDEDEEQVNLGLLQQLLQQRGHQLRKLQLAITADIGDLDLVNFLIQTCPRLKSARISQSESSAGRELSFCYKQKTLILIKVVGQGLRPLMQLFPSFRALAATTDSYQDTQTLESWIAEMHEFAAMQKKYCIRATVNVTDEASESFEGNLRLRKVVGDPFDDPDWTDVDDEDESE